MLATETHSPRYRGLDTWPMVNMTVDNSKLRERALSLLITLTGCNHDAARGALDRCQGQVKPATLVLNGLSVEQARRLLQQTDGRLRDALNTLRSPKACP